MILLALETSTETCSVALLRDESVVSEMSLNRDRAHAESLVPMIEDVLRFGGLAPADLDAVAVSSGPGSYTGLRIGASTAKGLASALDLTLVAVPSLEALAEAVRPFARPGDFIGAAFHARRDEAFAALFEVQAGTPLIQRRETQAIGVEDIRLWLASEPARSVWLVGDGWRLLGEDLQRISAKVVADVRPSAAPVARLGSWRLRENLIENVVTFEPHYLKEFVAKRPSASAFEKLPF